MSSPLLAEIDFLPADFHERKLRRRTRRWRLGVACVCLFLIGLGLIGNRLQYAQLQAEYERLRPRAEAVGDLEARVASVRTEIDRVGLRANLHSRLRLTPAMTRLLAATIDAMPQDLALTEFHVNVNEVLGSGAPSAGRPREDDGKAPELKDLERLREEQGRRQINVTVRGLARDDSVISGYLARLRSAGLFDEVRLLVADQHSDEGVDLRSFAVGLRVRSPGSPYPTSSRVAVRQPIGEGDAT